MPYIKNDRALAKLLETAPKTGIIVLNYTPDADLIAQFKDLREVAVREIKDSKLSFLKNIRKLETLRLENCGRIPGLPAVVIQLSSLKKLSIRGVNWRLQGWKGLEKMQQLTSLSLNFVRYGLPPQLFELTQLEDLSLDHFSGWKYELDLSGLLKLSNLKKLNVTGLTTYDATLSQLPKLEELICSVKLFNYNPEKLLDFDHLKKIKIEGSKKEGLRQTYKFYKHGIKTGNLQNIKPVFKEVFTEKKAVKDCTNEDLVLLLNCGVKEFVYKALEAITQRIEEGDFYQKTKLSRGTSIQILGKLTVSLQDWSNRLEEVAVQLSKKTAATVLLGQEPGVSIPKNIAYTTERHLQSWLEAETSPYLLEADSEIDLSHIQQLLLSHDVANIELAQQMMEGGGMPPNLVTECFLIYKSRLPKVLKDWAGQYLHLNASPSLREKYKRRKSLIDKMMDRNRRQKNLRFYLEDTELDALKVVQYLEKYYCSYINFALTELSSKNKKAYLKQVIQNGKLDLSHFTHDLPLEILNFKEQITAIRLEFRNTKQFPHRILQLLQLEVLDIQNYQGMELPAGILVHLPKLKVLKLTKYVKNVPSTEELEQVGCELVLY